MSRRPTDPRFRPRTLVAASAALLVCAVALAPQSAFAANESTDPIGALALLSDPYLQVPEADSVNVVWNTEFPGSGSTVLVGESVGALTETQLADAVAGRIAGVAPYAADTVKFSRLVEDAQSNVPAADKPAGPGMAERDVWRHEAVVSGLSHGTRLPYRVVSFAGADFAASGTFSLSPAARAGDNQRILITSDHQAMSNTAANLEMASKTFGDIDAVFLAGDLVNQPDRASEWFDDSRGGAFFPVLQGNALRASTNGEVYAGAEILQNAPIFTSIGNHEVQGRVDGRDTVSQSFNFPVPTAVAESEYAKVAATVNPTGDAAVRERWIEDNSFSTTTYEEMFSLPESSTGGETYYAVTVGDVRLISLYSTRIWRADTAQPDPASRTAISRYQETPAVLDQPLEQGYGEFIFEPLGEGSAQLDWLKGELASDEFTDARFRVVMLHEGAQTLGGNAMPHFTDPVATEETDASGAVTGIRYEYPADKNVLLTDLGPLLEGAGVDLVQQAHNHIWNRFVSPNGVNYIETSNTGNTYRAFHELSGNARSVPPAPWVAENYLAQGNPGGLEPVMPTGAAQVNAAGVPTPFVQSNNHAVFTLLDTGANEVISYIYDVRTPAVAPVELDRFSLGRAPVDPAPQQASVSLSSLTVAPGSSLSITGEGFASSEAVSAVLDSGRVPLDTKTAINGTVRMTVTIPASSTPGTHRIVLTGSESGLVASAEFTVTAAAELANTGVRIADFATISLGSLAAILLGAALLATVRSRRSGGERLG